MFNDEEEDENAIGVVRYPCMPSLVSLQQMRNRLHLAYLGRKLMKWTALATGRELRRLGSEINAAYKSFAEDLRNAFMLLARGRYFYPNLNKMVLENVPNTPSVLVASSVKTISGVKVIQYDLVESGIEPYEHLGIEKGGQKIHEAKVAWLELLKRMIMMLELRTSFALVETAHKNATKRQNVMNKIVIPRTQVTMRYIILQMQELAREELFRIKIIKKKKARKTEKETKVVEICPICNQPVSAEDDKTRVMREESRPKVQHEHKAKPIVATPVPVETPKPVLKPTPPPTPYQEPVPAQKLTSPPETMQPKPISTKLPLKVESVKEIYKPPSLRTMGEPNFTQFLSTEEPTTDRLEYLKKLLTEIIALGKSMVETGGSKINMEDFLKVCEEAKERINNFFDAEEEATSEIDSNLKDRLEHLKLHLKEVIDLTKNFRDETILSTSMEHFIETCEEVDEKLDVYVKTVDSKPINDDTKARLLYLKQQIKDVVAMTEDYKAQGLLTPSVEEFVKTCASVQLKIDEYTRDDQGANINAERIGHLKDHVGQLEKITTDIKQEGLASSSLEKFMLSCKDFKVKLEEYKKKAKRPRPMYDGDMSKLVEQLEETIDLSMLAKREGLIDESVDEFVKCCEDIKRLFETKPDEEEDRPQTLGELKTNISGVIKMITGLKAEGLISDSVEDFLKTCETTKDTIDVYERYPLPLGRQAKKDGGRECTGTCTSTCLETCSCNQDKANEPDEDAICDKCVEMLKEPVPPVLPYAPEPCDSCRGIVKLEDEELPYPCDSCTKPPEPTICIHCKKNIDEEENPEIHTACLPSPPPEEPPPPSPIDSSLGYFEKKIRKIVRVTRTMNDDGTIREEKETIIIRKNRHDPTGTSMDGGDDDDDDGGECDDIPDGDDEDMLAMFANINPNIGFNRKTKSEGILRVSSLTMPNLRQCISIDMNILKSGSFSDCSFEIVNSMQSLGHYRLQSLSFQMES